MTENIGPFADDDPDYVLDGADDIDLEVAELSPTDPKDMAEDQGDPGTAHPGEA
jgi:hypothetical protein